MRARYWLFVSVFVNALLLVLLIRTPRGTDRQPSSDSGASARAEIAAPKPLIPERAPKKSESLSDVRDVLRAAGVPADLMEQVLRGMLYKERYKATRASTWWKGTPFGGDLRRVDPMEMNEVEAELRRLVDDSAAVAQAVSDLNLDYLPEDKRTKVAGILRDYAEVGRQNRAAGMYIRSDQSREELLRDELQRDLREVLTPEEYLEHTLRDSMSKDWIRLRMDAASLDLTELEFRETARALLVARQIGDEKTRNDAVEKIHTALREKVGPDRIFLARAKNCFEYTQLRQAQVRFGFPQATTDRVIETWKKTYKAAEALRADTNADKAAIAEGWRALAVDTRNEILATLGAEVGNEYMTQSLNWLRDWESGDDTRISGGLMGKR